MVAFEDFSPFIGFCCILLPLATNSKNEREAERTDFRDGDLDSNRRANEGSKRVSLNLDLTMHRKIKEDGPATQALILHD